MKAQKRVKGRKKEPRIQASAGRKRGRRELPENWAELYKPIKRPVTLRLDADILDWFQRGGKGYQTRINRALRKLMMEKQSGR